MDVIDNVTSLLGDDLKRSIHANAKLSIAASSFSIYAYEALKAELEAIWTTIRLLSMSLTFR